ncbi:MAG TPA: hypothetical protein VK892_02520 [Pyrinomonadaceae bacterium]|nr:hypothetical protein [Pyrinomonadaceae bacterium]
MPLSGAAYQQKSDVLKPGKIISLFEKANFTISAKIYYGDQDEEEVAIKTEFYLLDKSVVEILRNAKFSPMVENKSVAAVTGEKNNSDSDENLYLEALADLLTEPVVT